MPSEIASCPLAESTRTFGRKFGDTRSGPRSRQDLLLLEDPADAADRGAEDDPHAHRVEAVQPGVAHRLAGCAQREQDVALELSHLLGRGDLRSASKSLTSAAMRTGQPRSRRTSLIQSMPLSPATAARQVDCASFPSGVTAPSPVTATLLIDVSLDMRPSLEVTKEQVRA